MASRKMSGAGFTHSTQTAKLSLQHGGFALPFHLIGRSNPAVPDLKSDRSCFPAEQFSGHPLTCSTRCETAR